VDYRGRERPVKTSNQDDASRGVRLMCKNERVAVYMSVLIYSLTCTEDEVDVSIPSGVSMTDDL